VTAFTVDATAIPGLVRQQVRISFDLAAMVAAAEGGLRVSDTIYQRGLRLVRLVWMRQEDDPSRTVVAVSEITPHELRLQLATDMDFFIQTENGTQRRLPPMDVVKALLEKRGWQQLPALAGVVDAPSMRPDGSILTAPGYDPATGLYYAPSGGFPPVPESPTREDARRALAELVDVYADFPFVAEADLAAVLATLLGLVGRSAILGSAPMLLVRSPTRGTGKSLVADVTGVIATGQEPERQQPLVDEVENSRLLLGIAMQATRMVLFDNVEKQLRSGVLAAALTGRSVGGRILKKNSTAAPLFRAVVIATGNNLTLGGDLPRRALLCELDSGLENPEERGKFRYPDLLGYVREQRPRLLVAALTVLRAFWVAGRPAAPPPRKGGYQNWESTVRSALVWAGGGDPTANAERLRRDADSVRDTLLVALTEWKRVYGDRPTTAAEVIRACRKDDELATAVVGLIDGKESTAVTLGYALRGVENRPVARMRFVAVNKGSAGVRWSVVTEPTPGTT
jgi:hypothetical protein